MKILDKVFYAMAIVVVYVFNIIFAYGIYAYDWYHRGDENDY